MTVEQRSPAEVRALLDAELVPVLLDVREPWEVEVCAIAGSRNLPMMQVPDALATLDRETPIVVVCHHGVRSLQVANFLVQSGFEKVINLSGGIDAWARDLDPGMATY